MKEHQPPDLRWEPDVLVADAARAAARSHIPLTDMSLLDKCFYVAALTAQGVTAEDIAAMSGCGDRTVKYVRAEPATIMALATRRETVIVERELREAQTRIRVLEFELAATEASMNRYRDQRDQIIDQLQQSGAVETFACGHPRVKYNVYRNAGKRYCRECRSHRQAARRAELRHQGRPTCSDVTRLTTTPSPENSSTERMRA